MKKLLVITMTLGTLTSAFAKVNCTTIKQTDTEFVSKVNDKVQAHINGKCNASLPYSVSPIIQYFHYDGGARPQAMQVCCTSKYGLSPLD